MTIEALNAAAAALATIANNRAGVTPEPVRTFALDAFRAARAAAKKAPPAIPDAMQRAAPLMLATLQQTAAALAHWPHWRATMAPALASTVQGVVRAANVDGPAELATNPSADRLPGGPDTAVTLRYAGTSPTFDRVRFHGATDDMVLTVSNSRWESLGKPGAVAVALAPPPAVDRLRAALRKIAASGPEEEPDAETYDDMESAYGNGADVAAWEAAEIARAALAADPAAQDPAPELTADPPAIVAALESMIGHANESDVPTLRAAARMLGDSLRLLAIIAPHAASHADDWRTGLDDGTYEDSEGLDAYESAIGEAQAILDGSPAPAPAPAAALRLVGALLPWAESALENWEGEPEDPRGIVRHRGRVRVVAPLRRP